MFNSTFQCHPFGNQELAIPHPHPHPILSLKLEIARSHFLFSFPLVSPQSEPTYTLLKQHSHHNSQWLVPPTPGDRVWGSSTGCYCPCQPLWLVSHNYFSPGEARWPPFHKSSTLCFPYTPTVCICVCLVAQSCLTLHHSMDCNPEGSSVHGTFQARILEWVAISFSKGIFLTQGSNLRFLCLLHWQGDSLPAEPAGKIYLL